MGGVMWEIAMAVSQPKHPRGHRTERLTDQLKKLKSHIWLNHLKPTERCKGNNTESISMLIIGLQAGGRPILCKTRGVQCPQDKD